MRKAPEVLKAEFRGNVGHLMADHLERFDPQVAMDYRRGVMNGEHAVKSKILKRIRTDMRLWHLSVICLAGTALLIAFRYL